MKILKQDSETMHSIEEIECIMKKAGISIISYSELYLEIDGNEFRIGKDSNTFPRMLDEPFILRE